MKQKPTRANNRGEAESLKACPHLCIARSKALRPLADRWARLRPCGRHREWNGAGRVLLGRWRAVAGLLLIYPITRAVFAFGGGFPVHEEALPHDLEADGAGHLQ